MSVVRYKVPFDYLATGTPIFTASSNASFNLNDVIMFQLISDVPNNCTTHPNCLNFNSTNFDFSLVFMNTTNNACSRNVTNLLDDKFKMPKCPSGWYSWTRPTGRLWCYMISKHPHVSSQTWNSTNSYCKETYNAALNGFQTIEERASFLESLRAQNLPAGFMYIGAVKSCATSKCDKTVQFHWQNEVSTNHSLANDNFYEPYFDGSGNCLAVMTESGMYDDVSCTQQTTFSCGKYADTLP